MECAGSRDELNRALHELRRPLLALMLLEERRGDAAERDLLRLVSLALADLDRAVNGGATQAGPPRRFACRELVLKTLERWNGVGASADQVEVHWRLGAAPMEGHRLRVAQALDNVIANAMEHGAPPVALKAERAGSMVRITVTSRGRPSAESGPVTADPRRGHGLRVAADVASEHGGRFLFGYGEDGTATAVFELPLVVSARPASLAAQVAGSSRG